MTLNLAAIQDRFDRYVDGPMGNHADQQAIYDEFHRHAIHDIHDLLARVRELEAQLTVQRCRHRWSMSINPATGVRKDVCDNCGAGGIVFLRGDE